MTGLKQQAINMIAQMPEEQVVFVIRFIENTQNMSYKKLDKEENNRAQKAFQNLQRLTRRGTIQDDYKEELEGALWEKYENIS